MKLSGVDVRDSAASALACLLHEQGEQALAYQLGRAIDQLHDEMALTPSDRQAVVRVLRTCPPELADLRAKLLADHVGARGNPIK